MARTFQQRDFDLLGYQSPAVVQDAQGFTAFSVTALAGLDKVPAYCLYLKDRITTDEAHKASRLRCADGQNFVVYHSGLQPRIAALKAVIGRDRKYFVFEDLLWERISATFDTYVASLREGVQPPHPYVTPRPKGDPKINLEEELLKWLSSPLSESQNAIQVIRAPAGVGKTSLARQLTRRLVEAPDRFRLIPVYVESEHWARVGVKSFEDLWTMIDNSLHHFDRNLHIPERLFNHLLQSGDVAFIFDGFDELCGHGISQFLPRDVLQQLIRLRAESAAKIILTTRTMYWESEVGEAPPEVNTRDLEQFTKQQAHDYFERRFAKRPQIRSRAHHLLGQVSAANQPPSKGGGKAQITYHPYIVDLVASSAEEGLREFATTGTGNLMLSLLTAKCEREQARRNLSTSAAQQLNAFEDLALDRIRAAQDAFSIEDCVFSEEECVIAGFDENDRAKLKDHPLIAAKRRGDKCEMRFRYDFLPHLLLARYLVRTIKSVAGRSDAIPPVALELMERKAEGTGGLIDQMVDLWDQEPLGAIGRCVPKVGRVRERAMSLLFHLAKAVYKSLEPSATRSERTANVLALFGGESYKLNHTIRKLYVHGTVDKFDLEGMNFESCTFVNVVFADCSADLKTRFQACRFLGEFDITGNDSSGWSQVAEPKECEMDLAARVVWADIGQGETDSNKQAVRDAIKVALGKFWYHGRLRRTIAKHAWNRGILGRLGMGARVLKAMEKAGLIEEIHISGVSEGGYKLHDDATRDVQQFMDNGQIVGRVRAAFEALV